MLPFGAMHEPNAELEDKALPLGGLFDPSTLAEPFASLLHELEQSAHLLVDNFRKHMSEEWAKRPLAIAFTNSDDVNACAIKGASTDYILISIGAVGRVYGTMAGMLSMPTFLEEVGNADHEESPAESLPTGFPALPLLRKDHGDAPIRFYKPEDPLRFAFSMQLASMALHFLVTHEVGHVVCGHLELLEQMGLEATVPEFRSFRTGPRMPPLHVLECDADTFAAHVQSFVDLQSAPEGHWESQFGWRGVSDSDACFIAHAVAVAVLFRMLDNDGYAPDKLNPSCHPHPAVRSNSAIARSFSLACGAGLRKMKELARLAEASLVPVEEAWLALELPGQRLGDGSTWAEQVARLTAELTREYERWKKVLVGYARIPPRWHGPWPRVTD